MNALALVAALALALAGVGGGKTAIRTNLGKTMPQTGSPLLSKSVWGSYNRVPATIHCSGSELLAGLCHQKTLTVQGSPGTSAAPFPMSTVSADMDGASEAFGLGSDALWVSDFTTCISFKPITGRGGRYQDLISQDNVGTARIFSVVLDTNTGGMNVSLYKNAGGSTLISPTAGTVVMDAWNKICVSFDLVDGSADVLSVYVNRYLSTDYKVTGALSPVKVTTTTNYVGRQNHATAQWFGGEVSEFAYFTTAFTQLQLKDMVDGYGPTSSVVAMGDSLTYGNTNPYPTQLWAQLGWQSWRVINAGVAGEKTADMLVRWNSTYSGQGHTWLLLLGGTNDCHPTSSVTAVDAYANLSAMVSQAKAQGMSVGIWTVPPSALSGANETRRTDLNALIATTPGVTEWDLSTSLKSASHPTELSQTAYGETNYCYNCPTDPIHINAAAHTIMANSAKGVISP